MTVSVRVKNVRRPRETYDFHGSPDQVAPNDLHARLVSISVHFAKALMPVLNSASTTQFSEE